MEKNLEGGQRHTVEINIAKCSDTLRNVLDFCSNNNKLQAMFKYRCQVKREKLTLGTLKFLRQKTSCLSLGER